MNALPAFAHRKLTVYGRFRLTQTLHSCPFRMQGLLFPRFTGTYLLQGHKAREPRPLLAHVREKVATVPEQRRRLGGLFSETDWREGWVLHEYRSVSAMLTVPCIITAVWHRRICNHNNHIRPNPCCYRIFESVSVRRFGALSCLSDCFRGYPSLSYPFLYTIQDKDTTITVPEKQTGMRYLSVLPLLVLS